jgi:hypothetical protein
MASAARANAADEISIGDFVEAIDGASIRGQSQGASAGAIETTDLTRARRYLVVWIPADAHNADREN